MTTYVVSQLIKKMVSSSIKFENSRVLLLGLSFKENCPDMRNSKVKDVFAELKEYGCNVDVYDPWVQKALAQTEYGISFVTELRKGYYEAIIICVAHDEFMNMGVKNIRALGKKKHIIYDLKHVFSREETDLRL